MSVVVESVRSLLLLFAAEFCAQKPTSIGRNHTIASPPNNYINQSIRNEIKTYKN